MIIKCHQSSPKIDFLIQISNIKSFASHCGFFETKKVSFEGDVSKSFTVGREQSL